MASGRGSVGGVGGFPPRAEEYVGLGADEVRDEEGRHQDADAHTQGQHLEEVKESFNVTGYYSTKDPSILKRCIHVTDNLFVYPYRNSFRNLFIHFLQPLFLLPAK